MTFSFSTRICRFILSIWLLSCLLGFTGSLGCGVFITRKIIKRKTFTYMGCYADKPQSRDLPIPGGNGQHMDHTECNEVCKRQIKTKFMGLQDGGWCWCGNRFNKYGKVPDSVCVSPCPASPQLKCGAKGFNSVFETA